MKAMKAKLNHAIGWDRVTGSLEAKVENRETRTEAAKIGSKPIVVRRYVGERELEKGLTVMLRLGYQPQDQATRKALASLGAGVLTRKQVHTVTFVKAER